MKHAKHTMSRPKSMHFSTYAEVQAELRDAADHFNEMMRQEAIASEHLERDGDQEVLGEAERQFLKAFKAYTGSARSARDYMESATNGAGHRDWAKERYKKIGAEQLFAFFNKFFDQSLHQYRPKLVSMATQIQVVSDPGKPFNEGPWTVTGVVNAKYGFTLEGLEKDTAVAFERLRPATKGEGIVEYSTRFLDELRQMLKNAERRNRFEKKP